MVNADHLINQRAIEILEATRVAEAQTISDRALQEHVHAASLDTELSVSGHLGAEAIRLYRLLERREKLFMGSRTQLTGLVLQAGVRATHKPATDGKKVENYAQNIVSARDGDITLVDAMFLARQQLEVFELEEQQNRILEGTGCVSRVDRQGYEYFAPPVLKISTDPANNIDIAQQVRVIARLPSMSEDHTVPEDEVSTITIRHEFITPTGFIVDTPTHRMRIAADKTVEGIIDASNGSLLSEREMFYPLGILIASREAVLDGLSRPHRKMVE